MKLEQMGNFNSEEELIEAFLKYVEWIRQIRHSAIEQDRVEGTLMSSPVVMRVLQEEKEAFFMPKQRTGTYY